MAYLAWCLAQIIVCRLLCWHAGAIVRTLQQIGRHPNQKELQVHSSSKQQRYSLFSKAHWFNSKTAYSKRSSLCCRGAVA
jgi:hypothetical protein